jgi:hypothetical protein
MFPGSILYIIYSADMHRRICHILKILHDGPQPQVSTTSDSPGHGAAVPMLDIQRHSPIVIAWPCFFHAILASICPLASSCGGQKA